MEMEIPAAVVSSSSVPPWIELPEDITANILGRLGALEILQSAQKVCITWRRVCQDPAMWRVIDLSSPGCQLATRSSQCTMRRLARRAVDCSQGELIDIRIDHFSDEELLNYIVDRSSHLRRLILDRCATLSAEALAKAVEKLPHLEELHLLHMPFPAASIADIGLCCLNLWAFTFDIDYRGLFDELGGVSEVDY